MLVSQEFLTKCFKEDLSRSEAIEASELYEPDMKGIDSEVFFINALDSYFGGGWTNIKATLLDDLIAMDNAGTPEVNALSLDSTGEFNEARALAVLSFFREFYLFCMLKNPQKALGLRDNTKLVFGILAPTVQRAQNTLDKIQYLVKNSPFFSSILLNPRLTQLDYDLKYISLRVIQLPRHYAGQHTPLGLIETAESNEYNIAYENTVLRYLGNPDNHIQVKTKVLPGKIITLAEIYNKPNEFIRYYKR